MEDAFEKLRMEGKNSVDSLIKWMQDSKLIDEARSSEEKARKLFADCADQTNVELKKFQEAVAKLAQEQRKSVEELTRMLEKEGPKFISALKAAANAFKDAMK